MAFLSKLHHVSSFVLRSRSTTIVELMLILLPTSLLKAPALVFWWLVVIRNPFDGLPLTLIVIGGTWGLISLWRYWFSLFSPLPAPRWAQFGLIAGTLTVIWFYLLGKNKGWLPAVACIPIALHWFWLKRQNVVQSIGSHSEHDKSA